MIKKLVISGTVDIQDSEGGHAPPITLIDQENLTDYFLQLFGRDESSLIDAGGNLQFLGDVQITIERLVK